MKNFKSFLTGALLLLFIGFNYEASAQQKYKINGTVIGFPEGKIYMMGDRKIDTIVVKKGKFQYENKMQDPVSRLMLMKTASHILTNSSEQLSLYIEPGLMTLQLEYKDFSKSKLEGSKSQDDNYRYDAIIEQIKSKYKKEQAAYDAKNKEYMAAAKAGLKDEKTVDKLKFEADDFKNKLEPMYEEMKAAGVKFMKDNPNSYVSFSMAMYLFTDLSYDEATAIYNTFNPLYKNTQKGVMIQKEIEEKKKGVEGAQAGDFNTVDINGKPTRLSDFKGQYLLIDFWASWCVPCRKGNPHLLKVYAAYKPKGLEILGVASDDGKPELWKKAVEKDSIGVWRHVLRGYATDPKTHQKINPEKDISDGYNIHYLPTKILVDPNGVIVGRYSGSKEDDKRLDEKLASVFGEVK